MSIFVLTNHFNRREKQYSNSIKLQLPYPTNNSIKIVKRALDGVRKDLKNKQKFIKITKAGFYESMVHNIDEIKKDSKY